MKVMITGGGTGGHTSPAVAILEELQRRDGHLLVQWAGRKGSIEERVASSLGVPFRAIAVEGWPRRRSIRRGWSLAKLAYGYAQALVLVRKFGPDVVVGVGGYVSLPVGLAAQHLGVPTVLHEQNKRLGLANGLLAKKATRVLLSYSDTIGSYPAQHARVVGNPVRGGFLRPPHPIEARKALGLAPDVPVVLVTGGSQGAQSLNQAARHLAKTLGPDRLQLVWAAGPTHAAALRADGDILNHVQLHAFIEDMVTASAAADIIIGRAGASSTAEIAALGKPSILVPYPHATDNHQEQNARAFEAAGAAVVVLDATLTGELLAELVGDLLRDDERRAAMGAAAQSLANPAAVDSIAAEILAIKFGEPGAPAP